MTESTVRVHDLLVRFDGQVIISGITFSLAEGACLMVAGPSGSGKSTLLKAVNRLVEPSGGSVYLKDGDVRKLPVPRLRSRVVYVPQSAAIGPVPVSENLRLGRAFRGESLPDTQIRSLLADVGLPESYLSRNARTLSGGEQYRLSLAMALTLDPEVLLLDEPTAHLDPELTERIADMVAERVSDGLSAIVVTHDVLLFRRLGCGYLFIDGGRIVKQGNITDIKDSGGYERLWEELRSMRSPAPEPVSHERE